jgi:hypothetical protein
VVLGDLGYVGDLRSDVCDRGDLGGRGGAPARVDLREGRRHGLRGPALVIWVVLGDLGDLGDIGGLWGKGVVRSSR